MKLRYKHLFFKTLFLIQLLAFITENSQAQADVDSDKSLYIVTAQEGCSDPSSGINFTITNNPANNTTCLCDAACPCDIVNENDDIIASIGTSGATLFNLSSDVRVVRNIKIRPNDTNFYDDVDLLVVPSSAPDFKLLNCSSRRIRVQILDSENNFDYYEIDWGDGSPTEETSSLAKIVEHTYPTTGIRNVGVSGKAYGSTVNCAVETAAINVVDFILAPVVKTLTVQDESMAQLTFQSLQSLDYDIEIAINNSSSFSTLMATTGVAGTDVTVDISNINLDFYNNHYTFRLKAKDACTPSNTKISNVVTSVTASLAIKSLQNQLAWVSSTATFDNFRVYRNGTGHISLSGVQLSHNDTDNVTCNVDYCYVVRGEYSHPTIPGLLVVSNAPEICGTSFSSETPTAITDISIQIENNSETDLIWQPTAFPIGSNQYTVYKGNKDNLSPIHQTQETNFIDIGELASSNYYRINYTDACGNSSEPGTLVQPILIKGNELESTITISWNNFTGWSNGVAYYLLQRFTEDGVLLDEVNTGNNTNHVYTDLSTDRQVNVFQVTAFPIDALLPSSISNVYSIIRENKLLVSNAFTPNGDGLNDHMVVSAQYVSKISLEVYNRWGELIFANNSLQRDSDGLFIGWDGAYNGQLLEQNSYTYKVILTDEAARTITGSGTVVLMK